MSVPLRILISGVLAFFTTVVGQKNHVLKMVSLVYVISSWIGKLWSWKKQYVDNIINKRQFRKTTHQSWHGSQWKKRCAFPMLFDSIPIENFICYCYMLRFFVNKIVESIYSWITEYVEPLSTEKIEMSNNLIDLQIELRKLQCICWFLLISPLFLIKFGL